MQNQKKMRKVKLISSRARDLEMHQESKQTHNQAPTEGVASTLHVSIYFSRTLSVSLCFCLPPDCLSNLTASWYARANGTRVAYDRGEISYLWWRQANLSLEFWCKTYFSEGVPEKIKQKSFANLKQNSFDWLTV